MIAVTARRFLLFVVAATVNDDLAITLTIGLTEHAAVTRLLRRLATEEKGSK